MANTSRILDAEEQAQVDCNHKVAEQNDTFRKAVCYPDAALLAARRGISGQVLLTPGVSGVDDADRQAILKAVADFSTFTPDNDPYEDHTFGAIEIGDHKLFWKIDLYDLAFKYGSEDPSNPRATRRVLTIMERSEY